MVTNELLDALAKAHAEIETYRQAIDGVLDLPFRGAEVHNRYLRFVLEHRRMPTDEETWSQINCPALAASQAPDAPSLGE